MSDLSSTSIVNPNSYGLYDTNMGSELAGTPNNRKRHTMQVEFILDGFVGAYHQPEDLANWIAQNPYVTSVTFTPDTESL